MNWYIDNIFMLVGREEGLYICNDAHYQNITNKSFSREHVKIPDYLLLRRHRESY